jgi:predicted phosphodiesterase
MIYTTGDTHGDLTRLKSIPSKKGDVIIICGDFGVIWNREKWAETNEKTQIEIAKNKEHDILFLDGNHENFNRIQKFGTIEKYGAEVGVYTDNIFHLKRGNIYTIEEKKFFVFGGGYSIDKISRTPNVSWWEQELPNFKEYKNGLDNLEKVNWEVDYILTHEGPKSICEELLYKYNLNHKDPNYDLSKYLEEIKNKTKFKHWFFSHYHLPIETFQEKFTQLYNEVIILEKET